MELLEVYLQEDEFNHNLGATVPSAWVAVVEIEGEVHEIPVAGVFEGGREVAERRAANLFTRG